MPPMVSGKANRKIIFGEYDGSGNNHVGTAALGCPTWSVAEHKPQLSFGAQLRGVVAEKIQDRGLGS